MEEKRVKVTFLRQFKYAFGGVRVETYEKGTAEVLPEVAQAAKEAKAIKGVK